MSYQGPVRRFSRDRRGATAIIFALAMIPIFGFIGSAIDYARAYMLRSKLQTALDSAVLAAGATPGLSNSERIEYAKNVFAANYNNELGVKATPTITITSDGKIQGSVATDLDASILGIIGIDKLDVGTTSEAIIQQAITGEIVLVLDYSKSMESKNKYKAMRDAAISLVDTVSLNGANKNVKFGLVPFSAEIYTTLPKAYVIGQSGSGNWTNCTADRRHPYNIQDSTPVSGSDPTKWGFDCDETYDNSNGKGGGWWGSGWGSGNWNDKKQCGNLYAQCADYPVRDLVVRPLTTDFTAVKNQLKSMRPLGYTHIALGMEFGWHLLSPNPPFTEGVEYGTKEHIKAIILLTDGAQTSDGWGPGNSHSVKQAEENLEDMCEAIKAKGVMVLTVGFDLDDKKTLERLKNCATKPSWYFEPKSNQELASAFQAITGQLVASLHLSK